MFHKINSSSTSLPAKTTSYELILLEDGKTSTIADVQRDVQSGNAVLLYPDPNGSSSSDLTQDYLAAFIDGGVLRRSADRLLTVSMGNFKVPKRESNKGTVVTKEWRENCIAEALCKAGNTALCATVQQQKTPCYAATQPHSALLQTASAVLQKNMYTGLSDQSLALFARTSRYANQLATSELTERGVKKLLNHVIHGEQAEAEAIIEKSPSLLLEIGRVTDYSGRTIEGTAFRLALGADDVATQDDEECMAEMIKRYLLTLPRGFDLMAEQYQAQFPEGWERQAEKRAADDLASLHKVLDAIGKAKPTDTSYKACEEACEPALVEFREYLESQAKASIIKTGKHFNAQLLVEAFKLYNDNYTGFGDSWDSPKNMLSWRKVCGFIQRFLPTCYAQAFSQGIYYITEGKEPLKRSLAFRNDPSYFFPLNMSREARVDDYIQRLVRLWQSVATRSPALLTKFLSRKNDSAANLMQRSNNQPRLACVVM